LPHVNKSRFGQFGFGPKFLIVFNFTITCAGYQGAPGFGCVFVWRKMWSLETLIAQITRVHLV
jgi:hypothetical protein